MQNERIFINTFYYPHEKYLNDLGKTLGIDSYSFCYYDNFKCFAISYIDEEIKKEIYEIFNNEDNRIVSMLSNSFMSDDYTIIWENNNETFSKEIINKRQVVKDHMFKMYNTTFYKEKGLFVIDINNQKIITRDGAYGACMLEGYSCYIVGQDNKKLKEKWSNRSGVVIIESEVGMILRALDEYRFINGDLILLQNDNFLNDHDMKIIYNYNSYFPDFYKEVTNGQK